VTITAPVDAWRGLRATEQGLASIIRAAPGALAPSLDRLEEWINAGYPEAGVPLDFDGYTAELAKVDPVFDAVYRRAAVITADGLKVVDVDFTADARAWSELHTGRLVVDIVDEQRAALRRLVADSIGRGQPVPTIAARVRQVVGLHERSVLAVDRYAQASPSSPTGTPRSSSGCAPRRSPGLRRSSR
jgi:hypothetical protein